MCIENFNSQGLFPNIREAAFHKDGAPPYIAKLVSTVLEVLASDVRGKGIWPGNSPDLNPIESTGSILKNSAYKPPNHTAKADLFKKIRSE